MLSGFKSRRCVKIYLHEGFSELILNNEMFLNYSKEAVSIIDVISFLNYDKWEYSKAIAS